MEVGSFCRGEIAIIVCLVVLFKLTYRYGGVHYVWMLGRGSVKGVD